MKTKCKYKDCDVTAIARGYCGAHYAKLRKLKDPSVFGDRKNEKKISFVVNENGCFVCTSHKPNSKGYPMFHRKPHRSTLIRFVYTQMFGEIPDGHVIRHTCDNRLCINPEHLLTGTPKQNTQDMIDRDRHARGSRSLMAKLDEDKVREIKRLLQEGKLNQPQIAAIYSVSRSAILHIHLGTTWKHV